MRDLKQRNTGIDVLKGLSIVSVILLHTYNSEFLLKSGAPFHIWQAVPIFIILQGYNNTNSYLKKEFQNLSEFYEWSYLKKKFQRLLLPYLIFFVFQLIVLWIDTPQYFASENLFFRFLTGGRGPGSYFVPLTIQAQLLLPFLYMAARKSINSMLLSSFMFGFGLEVLSHQFGIDEELYRLLIIRFIFALALGVALSMVEDYKRYKSIFITGILISIIYIWGVMYLDWHFIMEHYWHSQHIPGYFYPLLIVVIFIHNQLNEENWLIRKTALLGKASYHIFFVQMFYFWKPVREMRPDVNIFTDTLLNLFVCSAFGLLFYKLEQNFWKKIKT